MQEQNDFKELAQLKELENLKKQYLGLDPSDSTATGDTWSFIKSDNYFIRNLQEMVGIFSYVVKKKVEDIEKDIKQARKVYHG